MEISTTTLCLTPSTYGIPVPKEKPDVKVCSTRFNELCTLVRILLEFFLFLLSSNYRKNIYHFTWQH